MKKHTESWTVRDLRDRFNSINFPEYQREPSLWSRAEKQRLIDSMIREFDIASLYLYQHDEESIDCVDGRQRIGAIMAFLGMNDGDADNGFQFRVQNEIYDDSRESHGFAILERRSFAEIESSDDPLADAFVEQFCDYKITVVLLSDSADAREFNLQFTRLNLGTIINSGEKLNAMMGELRDECFSDHGIGSHSFLEALGIPTRRYAKEQLAAQILAQVFALESGNDYTRTRHYDLQRLFKQHVEMDETRRATVERVRELLDLLNEAFENAGVLRNRAIAVSTVLLAWKNDIETEDEADRFAEFIGVLQERLRCQIGKGLDVDAEYRYLVDFQRDITQASVEKPAVERRATVMQDEYDQWLKAGKLRGDEEWEAGHREE